MNKKIFVSIASYKDFDVINTIIDCFDKANNPNDVFVGLCLQDTEQEQERIINLIEKEKFYSNVRFIKMNAEEAQGCGWARNLIMKNLYNNEDCEYFINWLEIYNLSMHNYNSKIFNERFNIDIGQDEFKELVQLSNKAIYILDNIKLQKQVL